MSQELTAHALGSAGFGLLLLSTAGVAVLHTLTGPDHYLPFIVMGRARRWSFARTVGWTLLCGAGHVGSSVLLALGGVALGYGLERVQLIEEWRGGLAAWLMIAFGAVYLAWGLKRAWRGHKHVHAGATPPGGAGGQAEAGAEGFNLTPWVLFTIFVFGPCEPMIPLVMLPAAQGQWAEMGTVVALFSVLTLAAMLGAVLLVRRGLTVLPLARFERYTHAAAGGMILLSGCAIQFLGL